MESPVPPPTSGQQRHKVLVNNRDRGAFYMLRGNSSSDPHPINPHSDYAVDQFGLQAVPLAVVRDCYTVEFHRFAPVY